MYLGICPITYIPTNTYADGYSIHAWSPIYNTNKTQLVVFWINDLCTWGNAWNLARNQRFGVLNCKSNRKMALQKDTCNSWNVSETQRRSISAWHLSLLQVLSWSYLYRKPQNLKKKKRKKDTTLFFFDGGGARHFHSRYFTLEFHYVLVKNKGPGKLHNPRGESRTKGYTIVLIST